jgi:hypothetical protein
MTALRNSCLVELPPLVREAQEYFRENGSLTQAALLWLSIAAVVAMTIFLGVTMTRRARLRKEGAAWQVFGESLQKLKLSAAQRRFLREIATQPRLANPNVLLLSRPIFDRRVTDYVSRLASAGVGGGAGEKRRQAALLMGTQLCELLFQRAGFSSPTAM